MNTQGTVFLILNGKSACDEAVREAVMQARELGMPMSVRVTWEGGDAARYVREAIEADAETIIAGGGDGTLSEVATALAVCEGDAHALPALAVLPLGTANDFATAAELPMTPQAALTLARTVSPIAVDLLRIEADDGEHWCANLASGGFGTDVTTQTPETLKSMLGGLAYVLTGLGKLHAIEPIRAHFIGENFDWDGEFIALGIGNGRQAGGGQALCPDALVNDGLLDLTIVPPLRGELLNTLNTMLREGKNTALDEVAVRRRLRRVEITAPQPFTLNLDGEPVRSRRFVVHCEAGRLRMRLPAQCPLLADARPTTP